MTIIICKRSLFYTEVPGDRPSSPENDLERVRQVQQFCNEIYSEVCPEDCEVAKFLRSKEQTANNIERG